MGVPVGQSCLLSNQIITRVSAIVFAVGDRTTIVVKLPRIGRDPARVPLATISSPLTAVKMGRGPLCWHLDRPTESPGQIAAPQSQELH